MANGQANLLSPISPKTTKRSAIDHRQTMTTIPWPFCWILFLFLLNEVHSSAPWLLKIPRGGHEANPFEILEDRVVYSRWRVLTQRKVRMRNGKVVDFDVSFYSVILYTDWSWLVVCFFFFSVFAHFFSVE